MSANSVTRNSSSELLHELEALSQSLSLSNTKRRAASLVLDHSAVINDTTACLDRGSQSYRLISSRQRQAKTDHGGLFLFEDATAPREKKKGVWSWKPLQALIRVGMRRISCLFFVKVVAIQGVPPPMNGLGIFVAVRKKETKDNGAVRTIPSRVVQGCAVFEETLFVKCHLYYKEGMPMPMTFESRPFIISVMEVDAPAIDLGTKTVDLSLLVKESIERSQEGVRVREWDYSFPMSGKASGGELVVKLGFQLMDGNGGVSIYSRQTQGLTKKKKIKDLFRFSFARKESESSSFLSSMSSVVVQEEDELMKEDTELPEFQIVEKGTEEEEVSRDKFNEIAEKIPAAASSQEEIVKEVVVYHERIKELESIAEQIKALQSTFTTDSDGSSDRIKTPKTYTLHELDAKEVTVTKEFLQMLQLGGDEEERSKHGFNTSSRFELGTTTTTTTTKKNIIPDLGKGLGPVVQTRDGGYLVSMTPFNIEAEREEIPKLAMQISRPFVLRFQRQVTRLEIFQKLAAMGTQELNSKLLSLTAMDDLLNKTAEKVAFEGIASAIVSGRNKEGASFSAARSITRAKLVAKAMADSTGIWNVKEEPVTMEEMLAFSIQKIEAITVEGLKIQAGMSEEEAPFEVVVSKLLTGNEEGPSHLLDSAIPLEEWKRGCTPNESIALLATIQLRDPIRLFEPVGGLQIALVQAVRMKNSGDDTNSDDGDDDEDEDEDEERFKVIGIHVGGLKLKSENGREQLSAMQWLVHAGMGKAGISKKAIEAKISGKDFAWSVSTEVIADKWLKPMRNPNVNVR